MTLLKLLLLSPFAAALLAFAFANRVWVDVAFDPTGQNWMAPIAVPLYAALLVAAALGALVGGCLTWLGQIHHRRAARRAEAEAARLRQELQAARLPMTSLARSA